jgi:hypothetical protein
MPKSVYNLITFFPDRAPIAHHGSNLASFQKFLNKKFPTWKYFNVYYHQSRIYKMRIYNNN